MLRSANTKSFSTAVEEYVKASYSLASETVVSDELEALIAAKLGHPARDSHGDPIPTAELELPSDETVPLASLAVGAQATFVQVSDADPEMLRHLAGLGISPGDELELLERQPFGGSLLVRVGGGTHSLGAALGDAMCVDPAATKTHVLPGTDNGDKR